MLGKRLSKSNINNIIRISNIEKWKIFLVGGFSFLLYFMTGMEQTSFQDFSMFPFGADTPWYVNLFQSPPDVEVSIKEKHPLSIYLAQALSWILSPIVTPVVGAKLFNALLGCLNIMTVLLIFNSLTNNSNHAVLATLIYALSGTVWFFSSFPESYILTTLLGSIYLLIFMNENRSQPENVLARSCILVLGTLNEVIFSMILIVPISYYGMRLIRDKSLLRRESISVLIAGIASVILLIIFVPKFLGNYFYLATDVIKEDLTTFSFYSTFNNFLYFSIGLPSDVTSAPYAYRPEYLGFFQDSLYTYLERPVGIFFLTIHIIALGMIIGTAKMNANWFVPLSLYVLARLTLVHFFNPTEAILYTSPISLPLIIMIVIATRTLTENKVIWLLLVYLIAIIATNWGFYKPYLLS